MTWWGRLAARRRLERQLDSELRFHIENQIRANICDGMNEREARRKALLEFGSVDLAKDDCRKARGTGWIEDLLKDLRYAVRTCRRSPVFTAVVVISLAVGIGANTALYSVLDARFLRKLPVENPDELVFFRWSAESRPPGRNIIGTCCRQGAGNTPFPVRVLEAFRESGDPLSEVFASSTTTFGAAAAVDGQADRVSVQFVSRNFFSGLGISAAEGRTIAAEDEVLSATGAVMISNAYWRRRFDSRADVVGTRLLLNGKSFAIVGVLPGGFRGIASHNAKAPDFWMPLSYGALLAGRQNGDWWLHLAGRMAPGANAGQVHARLEGIYRGLVGEEPGSFPRDARIHVVSASRGIPEGGSDSLFFGLLVAGFVSGLLLLIVCLNVANLLLARSETRRREIEVRRALGAGRYRLLRQLFVESMFLALAGGVLGTMLASWGKDLFALAPSFGEELDLRIDARVLGFSILASMVSSVIFGLTPAWQATRDRVARAVGSGARTPAASDSRFGKLLLAFQVAMSVVLLTGAVFLVRILGFWQTADTGFLPDNMLVFQISPGTWNQDSLVNLVEAELRAIPGVLSTSVSDPFFGSGGASGDGRVFYGPADIFASKNSGAQRVRVRSVGPRFFETLGISVLRGRRLEPADDLPLPRQAVIDQTLARTLFPESGGLGERFGFSADRNSDIEVVGVVNDVRIPGASPGQGPYPTVYLPEASALAGRGQVSIEVRTRTDAASMIPAIRSRIAVVDRGLPLEDLKTMRQGLAERLTPVRHLTLAWSVFGGVSLLLTCIGLYGLLSYFVERHTKEIGLRMALGAGRSEVLQWVMRRYLLTVSIALAAGLSLSWPVHQVVRSQIYGETLFDPLSLGTVIGILLVVAAAASYLPARRAALADPMDALRRD